VKARGVKVFDQDAGRYDAWFDSEPGHALFASEVLCLRRLSNGLPRPWLSVGVGTGRFAQAVGVDIGVDPAWGALQYAARRGVRAVAALGQALPFEDERFGAVFVIVTLCFADEPVKLLQEAGRVTHREGGVVMGIVPAESPWGRFYAALGRAGHTFYSLERFFSLAELKRLAEAAELRVERSVSTLFQSPGHNRYGVEVPREAGDPTGGFVAVLCRPCSSRAEQNAPREEHRG